MKLLSMNNRIKYIFGFITISILGLILTQFFWLYKDYKYYSSQPLFSTQYDFFMPAMTAMELVVPDSLQPVTALPVDAKKVDDRPQVAQSIIAYPTRLMPRMATTRIVRRDAPGVAARGMRATRLPELATTTASGWAKTTPTNVPGVAPTEDITVLPVTTPRISADRIQGTPISGLAVTTLPANVTRRVNATSSVPAELYSAIPYKAPSSYIIDKMKWQFGGSMLLIIITSSCLIYMLITIYTQRKISLMKNDFINNMTHELKTPLATVAVAVEAMRNYGALEDSDKTQLYLNISKNEIDHLSKLIEMILQQSVFDTDKMHLEKKHTNINQLLEQLIESYQLSYTDIELIFHYDPHTPNLFLDPVHLLNAVRNLIDNAIKYATDNKKIIIASTYEKGVWLLHVTDYGIGIPKAYHKDIFERFFRVPGKQTATVKGFGLGLSYVKQVVELHKGIITVQSNEHGSTFTITITFKD